MHELVPGAGLVGALLRGVTGGAGRTAKAEGQAHPALGGLVIRRNRCREGGVGFWVICHMSVEKK